MKKALAIIGIVFALVSSTAYAAYYNGYYAEAHGTTSAGWGFHPTSPGKARAIALDQCNKHATTYPSGCYVGPAIYGSWWID